MFGNLPLFCLEIDVLVALAVPIYKDGSSSVSFIVKIGDLEQNGLFRGKLWCKNFQMALMDGEIMEI